MSIELRSQGAVAVVTIDRPEVANAIDRPTAYFFRSRTARLTKIFRGLLSAMVSSLVRFVRPPRSGPVESVEASPGLHHRLLDGVIRIEGRAQHAVAVPPPMRGDAARGRRRRRTSLGCYLSVAIRSTAPGAGKST